MSVRPVSRDVAEAVVASLFAAPAGARSGGPVRAGDLVADTVEAAMARHPSQAALSRTG